MSETHKKNGTETVKIYGSKSIARYPVREAVGPVGI